MINEAIRTVEALSWSQNYLFKNGFVSFAIISKKRKGNIISAMLRIRLLIYMKFWLLGYQSVSNDIFKIQNP